jgi:hypothetical protein
MTEEPWFDFKNNQQIVLFSTCLEPKQPLVSMGDGDPLPENKAFGS